MRRLKKTSKLINSILFYTFPIIKNNLKIIKMKIERTKLNNLVIIVNQK